MPLPLMFPEEKFDAQKLYLTPAHFQAQSWGAGQHATLH